MKEKQRLVFVDIETGGTEFSRPIIEIAAIAVQAGTWQELETIEMKVEFDVSDCDPKALGIAKFKPSDWRYAFPREVAAEKFAAFLREHATVKYVSRRTGKSFRVAQLVGHNAERFDGPFLRSWYKRLQLFFPAGMRVLCTKQLAMWFFEMNQGLTPPDNYKLETLCKYFYLSAPDHSALRDIRSTVELALKISELQMKALTLRAA